MSLNYWTRRLNRLERQVLDPKGFDLERIKRDLVEAKFEQQKEKDSALERRI